MNQENQGVNYSMALKNYNQHGHGIGIRQTQCLYVLGNRELQDEQTMGNPFVIIIISKRIVGISVEAGQWHRLESLESGTVILECKDGVYEKTHRRSWGI